MSNFPGNRKYDPVKRPDPSFYARSDCDLRDRQEDKLNEALRKAKLLPKDFLDSEKVDDTIDVDAGYKYLCKRQDGLSPYFTWAQRKNDIDSYLLYGACRWWAPSFEITLAREGRNHATVINKDNTKVFDLLYWGLDGRVEEHMFGDIIPFPLRDETLGGRAAYIDSAGPILYRDE